MRRTLLTIALLCTPIASAFGDDPAAPSGDEAAIRKTVDAYVSSFNNGDAKALAAMWTPEAVYTNPQSGAQASGREAIEKQFADIFADKKARPKLEASTTSIDFVSPGVAIEHGTATLVYPNQAPEESDYTAVYVKREGKWLVDRIKEETVPAPPSNYEHLKELEWLVGSWSDQDEHATVVTQCHWAKNNNFLVRSFAVQVGDRVDMSGMQIIGWDPSSKQIRSWVFDSDGSFGQGHWKKKGDRWYTHQSGVLADGRKTSSVNVLTRIDDNTATVQAIDRTVDGELLPNIDEVQITKE